MLQAHSLLWHYLWLAPDILQAALAIVIYRNRLYVRFPAFFVYLIYEAAQTFILYAMDVSPAVSAEAYWRAYWVALVIGGLVKFAVIGELFRDLLRSWPALSKTGNRLLTFAGVVLTLVAAFVAAYTTPYNPHWLVAGANLLQQTLYLIQCGLILCLFLFAAYFKVVWDRLTFGIALGFALVFCQHLASWAIISSVSLRSNGVLPSFLNMATYHVCVLIWCYYLLVPQKVATTSAVALPENDLAIWNRELERLLQQ